MPKQARSPLDNLAINKSNKIVIRKTPTKTAKSESFELNELNRLFRHKAKPSPHKKLRRVASEKILSKKGR